MKDFFRVAWLVVRKDLMVEARSLEVVSTTLFFALTVVLVFAFGLVREGRPVDDVAAAILWIATAFSARWRWAARSSANGRPIPCGH
jgi:ABC-type transport system involved in cytochrome c biogenesis permease component